MAAGVDERMPKRPEDHSCPITYEVMTDPVTAGDGMTYERAAIEQWLSNRNNSPSTGAELPHKIVVPNQALKCLIREWEEAEHKKCMELATPVLRHTTSTLKAELQRRVGMVPPPVRQSTSTLKAELQRREQEKAEATPPHRRGGLVLAATLGLAVAAIVGVALARRRLR